ncbi:cytochrome c biogenesis CcdA family protein [Streptomyces evansiae]|uniref:cytochrome c biogenesis CcdA family protein n=1 Tax=Streptomyces evansiae TaxID=3075535 RepID=UPI002885681C|nr:cytochrome c biogenesis protein CcdA [Streptomyces sp. DSM 41859]MDT0420419.1 cytochrome c biogenesis protein CcdA [Streptomyces sp. DSM 41859]
MSAGALDPAGLHALAALGDTNETVMSGALLLAVPVAVVGGLVSFFSPCVLPLVPGYLSYVTGISGVDMAEKKRGRMFTGASLFVLGFSIVFVSGGALFGYFGQNLFAHQELISRLLGALMILLGVFFMGLMPWMSQREFRVHARPTAGLVSAPLLGAAFGVGWTPCVGPTLTSALALSADGGSAGRGALITFAYCLGLGVPFVVAALVFRKALGAFSWVKRHYNWVLRIGGTMMIVTGVLLLTGVWDSWMQHVQTWTANFQTGI